MLLRQPFWPTFKNHGIAFPGCVKSWVLWPVRISSLYISAQETRVFCTLLTEQILAQMFFFWKSEIVKCWEDFPATETVLCSKKSNSPSNAVFVTLLFLSFLVCVALAFTLLCVAGSLAQIYSVFEILVVFATPFSKRKAWFRRNWMPANRKNNVQVTIQYAWMREKREWNMKQCMASSQQAFFVRTCICFKLTSSQGWKGESAKTFYFHFFLNHKKSENVSEKSFSF